MRIELIEISGNKEQRIPIKKRLMVEKFLSRLSELVGGDLKSCTLDCNEMNKDTYYLLFDSYFDLVEMVPDIADFQSRIILMGYTLRKIGLAADEERFAGFTERLDLQSDTPLMYGRRQVVEKMDVDIPRIKNIHSEVYVPFYDKNKGGLAELLVDYLHVYDEFFQQ